MSRSRLDLYDILKEKLGSSNVYFQPTENVKINYPCVVYHLNSDDVRYADNNMYTQYKQYKITIIDKNPDSPIPDKIANIPLCRLNTSFTRDNLNHYIYLLYF